VKQKRPAAEYPSTNISSPARAPTKRNIRDYAFNESAGNAVVSRQKQPKSRSRYEVDNFIVPDNENDEDYDDGFEPIREANPPKPKRNRTLGRPITVDARIAGLTESQRVILDDFVVAAKEIAKQIQIQRNLRNQPFSDTVLREMGLDLPGDEGELKLIPNVNPEMAERYGSRFLSLVGKVRQMYGNHPPPTKNQSSVGRVVQDDDEDEQAPMDPNHRMVIDLLSDDERNSNHESEHPGTEEDEPYSDEGDMDEDDAPHVSHHFTSTPIDPEVEDFRRRMSQVESVRPAAASSSRGQSAPKTVGGRGYPRKKKNFQRRSSGPYAGVSKKGVAKKAAPKRASNTSAKRPSDGGGGTGGGRGSSAGGTTGWSKLMSSTIKAMPS
jgi:bloom syndrome protein